MNNDVSKDDVKSVKNAYFRAWRKKNPESMKKAQEKYWTKKAQEKKNNKSQL